MRNRPYRFFEMFVYGSIFMKKSFFLILAAITAAGNLPGVISTDTKHYNFDLTSNGGGMTNVVCSDANGKVALSNPGEVSFTDDIRGFTCIFTG